MGVAKRRVRSEGTQEEERKGILSDFSMITVIASVLAAVTSFALSSRIGLAGSFIGTAIAAAASSVATQVYKGMLSASADKLKEIVPSGEEPSLDAAGDVWDRGSAADPRGRRSGRDLTRSDWSATGTDFGVTRTIPSRGFAGGPDTLSDKTSPHMLVSATGTPVAPASIRAAAAEREARALRKRLMVFAGAVAVVMAFATAGVIVLVTHGYGIGPFGPAEGQDEYAYEGTATEEAYPVTGGAEAWDQGVSVEPVTEPTSSGGEFPASATEPVQPDQSSSGAGTGAGSTEGSSVAQESSVAHEGAPATSLSDALTADPGVTESGGQTSGAPAASDTDAPASPDATVEAQGTEATA